MVVGTVNGIVGQITDFWMIDVGTVWTCVVGNDVGTFDLVMITFDVIPGIGMICVGGRMLVTADLGTITGEITVGGIITVGGSVCHVVNDVGIVTVYHGETLVGGGGTLVGILYVGTIS